jgi:hypothetical protein
MAQQLIGTGAVANDGTGDDYRTAFTKANDNFTELFAGLSAQADNIIVVNSESDFPVQDASTITLATNTQYFLGGVVNTAKTFTINDGVTLASINPFATNLIYTGSGTLFNAANANWGLKNIGFTCANGTIFNSSGTGKTFTMENVLCFSATNVGTFTNIDIILQTSGVFNVSAQGLVMAGAINIFSVDKMHLDGTNAAFVAIDLGVATFDDLEINDLEAEGISGSIAIKGAAASANINANRIATVTNSTLNGNLITPISGIANTDIRWSFTSNSGVSDTIEDALVSLSNSVTETVITTAGVPVKVLGTWVVERESLFTCDTTGKCIYIGERDITLPVGITSTTSAVSGTNKSIKTYLAVNGTVVANSGVKNRVSSADPKNSTVLWQPTLSTNDYLETFIENTTDTINLIVEDAVLRVR